MEQNINNNFIFFFVDAYFWEKYSRFRMKQQPIVFKNSLICPPSFHGSFRSLVAVVDLILKVIDPSMI